GLVVHSQDRQTIQCNRKARSLFAGLIAAFKTGGEMKRAPFSELTIEPHAPVHHSDELHRDGESQTCAAEASGHGAIGLAEGLKNDFPAVYRNPWSSIPHGEMQYDRGRSVV